MSVQAVPPNRSYLDLGQLPLSVGDASGGGGGRFAPEGRPYMRAFDSERAAAAAAAAAAFAPADGRRMLVPFSDGGALPYMQPPPPPPPPPPSPTAAAAARFGEQRSVGVHSVRPGLHSPPFSPPRATNAMPFAPRSKSFGSDDSSGFARHRSSPSGARF